MRVQVDSGGMVPNLPLLDLRASRAMFTRPFPKGSSSCAASCDAFNDQEPVTR